jgi:hypothetical protein
MTTRRRLLLLFALLAAAVALYVLDTMFRPGFF